VLVRVVLAVALCGCPRKADPPPVPVVVHDAAAAVEARPTPPWPELADYPRVEPVRVIELPARPDVPRFEVAGPVIAGDVAVVASSQLGFAAVDWRRGQIVWTKPAGEHVAPPLVRGDSVVLIGECVSPPGVGDDHLLGCVRVVTTAGTDEAYLAIHGNPKKVQAFAAAAGAQDVWPDGEKAVRWRRGDAAVTVDLMTGVATPAASAAPPPLVIQYQDRRWDITLLDGRIVARDPKGKELWATKEAFTALVGAVWLPGQSPGVRVARQTAFDHQPEIMLHDIDATGSLHGQVAVKPAPGIQLLGWSVSPVGDAALAVRLDNSLRRDYIAAYTAAALLAWVWTLPDTPRADPVGVAIAPDAVVVFHDGDTFTVLPALSASQNPTP